MKILFLHDKYIKNGGAERCIHLERKKFEKNGDKTFLFTTSDNPLLNPENSKIVFTGEHNFLGSYKYLIKIHKELKKYINEINPDLIYIHNNYEYPFSFLGASRGRKTIQKAHDFGVICPSRWCVYKDNFEPCDGNMGIKCLLHGCVGFKTFLSCLLKIKYVKNNRAIEKFISPSKNLQRHMLKNGFKNVSIESNPFEINEGREKIKRKKNLYLYVGGLFLHKGVALMIEAIKKASEENPSIRLNVIGTGPAGKRMKEKVKEYGLGKNVFFLGQIKNNYLYRYYKESSAVIFPSIWKENAPYVLAESLFFKTPVISSDINTEKGFLLKTFKHGDSEDLAKKILEISI